MIKKEQIIFNNSTSPKDNIYSMLTQACSGLIYVSETDAPVLPYYDSKTKTATPGDLITSINPAADVPVEEIKSSQFFDRLTIQKDWYGELEIKRAKRFSELRRLMESELRDLTVFRVGQVQIDIYVIGIDRLGWIAGIKTNAVET